MPKRAPEEGPTTANRAGLETRDIVHETDEAQARANAMRDAATAADGRGAGAARPKQQDPKAHLEAQAAARAASTAQAALFAGQFASLTEGAMGDGAFDADEDVEQELVEEKEETVQVRKQGPSQKPGPEFGGEADPFTPPDESVSDAPADPAKRGPARWPRVSPNRRIRQLDLDRLLKVGEAEGLLVGWQGRTVRPRVLGLNSQWFHTLGEAFEAAPDELPRIVLLKALAAHRHPIDVAALAPAVHKLGAAGILAWRDELENERPVSERGEAQDAPSIELLRRHYDPIASLATEEPGLPRPETREEWRIPLWLRGTRREALELCAVAFHQAACDHLHPEWETSDGTEDTLMAALETHYGAHPAIARWCTTLGARSADHAGLWSAIDALRRARSTV
jgi:hypothetical protein